MIVVGSIPITRSEEKSASVDRCLLAWMIGEALIIGEALAVAWKVESWLMRCVRARAQGKPLGRRARQFFKTISHRTTELRWQKAPTNTTRTR